MSLRFDALNRAVVISSVCGQGSIKLYAALHILLVIKAEFNIDVAISRNDCEVSNECF